MVTRSLSHNPSYRADCRRGVTLVELLVVILLVMIVSVLALQTLAPALKGRRLREAARQLEVFISRARNRAMASNRPFGFQIERLQDLPEAAMVFCLVESPEPYTGDFENSGVEVHLAYDPSYKFPPGPPSSVLVVRPSLIALDPMTKKPSIANRDLDTWNTPDTTIQTLVREGDQIELEGSLQRFTLKSVVNSNFYAKNTTASYLMNQAGKPLWYIGENVLASPMRYDANGNYVMNPSLGPLTYGSSVNVAGYAKRYKIYQQPTKVMGGVMTLPEQTVVDLNYSGVTGCIPFHARMGDSAHGYKGAPYCGDPFYSGDTEPITVMFKPDGTIFSVKYRSSMNGTGLLTVTESIVSSPINLLVGKRQRVPADTAFVTANQANNNWTDMECFWISINPSSGFIVTAENMPVLPGMNPDALDWAYNVMHNGGDPSYRPNGTGPVITLTKKECGNLQDKGIANVSGNKKVQVIYTYDALDHVAYGARRMALARLAVGGR